MKHRDAYIFLLYLCLQCIIPGIICNTADANGIQAIHNRALPGNITLSSGKALHMPIGISSLSGAGPQLYALRQPDDRSLMSEAGDGVTDSEGNSRSSSRLSFDGISSPSHFLDYPHADSYASPCGNCAYEKALLVVNSSLSNTPAGLCRPPDSLILPSSEQAPGSAAEGAAGMLKPDCLETATVAPRNWSGLGRDTLYFFGLQVAVVGILYVLPESVSGWSEEKKEAYDFDRWVQNVSKAVWDEDKWYVNYIFHPYWGGTYYIRARERNFTKLESFLYSAFLSTAYEYGIEAFFEYPSIQDLIVTPIAGSVVGMYFEHVRDTIKAKGPDLKWYDEAIMVMTDPLGVAGKYLDRLFGIKESTDVRPLSSLSSACRQPGRGAADRRIGKECRPVTGISVSFAW